MSVTLYNATITKGELQDLTLDFNQVWAKGDFLLFVALRAAVLGKALEARGIAITRALPYLPVSRIQFQKLKRVGHAVWHEWPLELSVALLGLNRLEHAYVLANMPVPAIWEVLAHSARTGRRAKRTALRGYCQLCEVERPPFNEMFLAASRW